MLARIAGYVIDVRVDPALVRDNEVRQLVGSRAKLRELIGPQTLTPLETTLRRMYDARRAPGADAQR